MCVCVHIIFNSLIIIIITIHSLRFNSITKYTYTTHMTWHLMLMIRNTTYFIKSWINMYFHSFNTKSHHINRLLQGNCLFLFFFCVWLQLLYFIAETIKVFDGNCSLRRRIYKAVTVARQCNLEQLLETASKAFQIRRDYNVSSAPVIRNGFVMGLIDSCFFLQEFYLTDLYAPGPEECRVQDPTPVLNLHRMEGKRPAVILRYR